MINTLEKSARTVDAAIDEALKELGLNRDDVSVEILEMGKTGFLGFGAVPARVRVSYETPDPAPVKPAPKKAEKPAAPKAEKPVKAEKPAAAKAEKPAKAEVAEAPAKAEKSAAPAAAEDENADAAATRAFLQGLLERMGVEAGIEIRTRENNCINVNLTGSSMGAIIGRRGETLDAIQHLVNYVVNKDSEKHVHITVDAEAYRSKREDSLTRLAEKMAEKAIKYKRSMALEPMNSYERHVIHTALQNYEGVSTSSTGVEPNRRVVVSYVRSEKSERPERPERSERSERAPRAENTEARPANSERKAANKPVSREWA